MADVLIIGQGGREHALGWNLQLDDNVSKVFYAPGNAGTEEGAGRNLNITPKQFDSFWDYSKCIAELIEKENIGMVLVGPEDPLAAGLVDNLNSMGYDNIFGPSREAAKLESDKFYSYDLMDELGIPQAKGIKCYSLSEAVDAIKKMCTSEGVVLKSRRLHAGKGVTVCDSLDEALSRIEPHMKQFKDDVLVSERLVGQEYTVFDISAGESVYPILMSFQDHKPLLDGDKGPNTGGMGAYGPASIAGIEDVLYVSDNVVAPVVKRMAERGTPYKGLFYAGMIMAEEGPKVIEFNVRLGDPEAQPAMMMLDSLYVPLKYAIEGKIDEVDIGIKQGASCCVVLAADGYPGSYDKGTPIYGIEKADQIPGVKVFHAGTAKKEGKIVTSGGRVLGVTARSRDIEEATQLAYEGVRVITKETNLINEDKIFHYRTDIAKRA